MPTIAEILALAQRHHRAGNLTAAEQLYRHVVQVEPRNAECWNNLASTLYAQRNYQAAAAHYQEVVRLAPDAAEAHHNLANTHQKLYMLEEAVRGYRQAVLLKPCLAEAHNNLGIVLKQQGKLDEAIRCYRQALRLRPDLANAHNNLGNALRQTGLLEESLFHYQQAVGLDPRSAEAHTNLGLALMDQGRLDEAVASCRQAALLEPNNAEVQLNLGSTLQGQGKLEEATSHYQRAMLLEPTHVGAHRNLGSVLKEQGGLEEALACYQRALELQPDNPAILVELVNLRQHLCLWQNVQDYSRRVIEAVERNVARPAADMVGPFPFLTLPTPTTALQQHQCAQQWAQQQLPSPTKDRVAPQARANSKITIGYLSADFHEHATAYLIVELLEKHDRDRFTVVGYSFGRDDQSAMRRRLVKACDRFVDLQDVWFTDAARRIETEGVDILVDLKGYTKDNRAQILALRPAPIQVNYLGYPGTMGAPFIDYILVDDYIVPASQQPYFTEKLVHLPGCYQVNDSRRLISPKQESRAAYGLPDAGFVFCCFNNNYKITAELFDVWMSLLKAVPGSVLWLLEGNRFAPANLRRAAAARGVAPDRLVFASWLPLPEHLARYRRADLFLDTFPVNAHTTASDALWAGCPVLTLTGETFVARVAGSLLRALGLPELIVTSIKDYFDLALRLANRPDLLAELRARIHSPTPVQKLEKGVAREGIFDGSQFARNLERAFSTIWTSHLAGENPKLFAVSPI